MPEFRYHADRALPADGAIFVFGSNLAGRHGAGAAKVARDQFGAEYGRPRGRTGNAYAIPTKDARRNLRDPEATLPVDLIAADVGVFIAYARTHPELSFFVTRIGCGLAGHPDGEIAPLFRDAPSNCSFPVEWRPFLSAAPTAAPMRHRPR